MDIKEANKILQLLYNRGKFNSKQLSEKKGELNKLEEWEIKGFIEKLPNHGFSDKEIEEIESASNINIGTKANQVFQDRDKAFLILSFCCGLIKAITDNAGDFIQIILFAIFYPIIFGILPAAIVSIFTKKFSYKLVFIFSLIAFILSTIGTYQLNNIAP